MVVVVAIVYRLRPAGNHADSRAMIGSPTAWKVHARIPYMSGIAGTCSSMHLPPGVLHLAELRRSCAPRRSVRGRRCAPRRASVRLSTLTRSGLRPFFATRTSSSRPSSGARARGRSRRAARSAARRGLAARSGARHRGLFEARAIDCEDDTVLDSGRPSSRRGLERWRRVASRASRRAPLAGSHRAARAYPDDVVLALHDKY